MKNDYAFMKSVQISCVVVLLGAVMVACAACAGKHIPDPENLVVVTLDGGTEHQIVAIFGAVVASAPGVKDVRMVASKLVPDSPQASRAVWNVNAPNADAFAMQTAIMKMLQDIVDSRGSFTLRGTAYTYAEGEIALLKGIRPGSATASALQFVVDREQMRDQEFFGR